MLFWRGLAVFLMLALVVGLGACGKKSALAPPLGDKDRQFPQTYPRR